MVLRCPGACSRLLCRSESFEFRHFCHFILLCFLLSPSFSPCICSCRCMPEHLRASLPWGSRKRVFTPKIVGSSQMSRKRLSRLFVSHDWVRVWVLRSTFYTEAIRQGTVIPIPSSPLGLLRLSILPFLCFSSLFVRRCCTFSLSRVRPSCDHGWKSGESGNVRQPINLFIYQYLRGDLNTIYAVKKNLAWFAISSSRRVLGHFKGGPSSVYSILSIFEKSYG